MNIFKWCKEKFFCVEEPIHKSEIQYRFDNIMAFANDVALKNPQALIDLVRVLLRETQASFLMSAIENEKHKARWFVIHHLFFTPNVKNPNQLGAKIKSLDAEARSKFLVRLNRDPVLTQPWNRKDYVRALSIIGAGKTLGAWKQDVINHQLSVYLPWGIVFVGGGNHSIASGIIGGEGELEPTEVLDYAELLDLIVCDGSHYRSSKNGEVIDKVDDPNIAAVFEIGRLMRLHNVAPLLKNSTSSTA